MWFADEARIGQKNKIKNKSTRRWAKRGTRPAAPRDQRTTSTYIFGAVCPKQGKGAGLVLPRCNIEAMNLHVEPRGSPDLAEIALAVAPGAHAIVLLDQAEWHTSKKLIVPSNITLVPLPPKCPEPWRRARHASRERLAVHARQLALEPHLSVWRGPCRPLLRSLEQARRPALVHHLHRTSRLGA